MGKQEGEGTSHLYTMILKPDNTVLVEIDQEEIYKGSIKDDWEVLKPKEISDPDDKKPEDWSDESMIDDPAEKKPDDWVEEKRIVDSEAKKPDDWDDEEDGEWEAPMKDNPAYKGDWTAKRISNPAYKGFWEAKRLQTQNMRMTMRSTNSMTLASLGLTCGRSRVAPSSTTSSSLMTKLKQMPLQKNGKI